MANTTINVVVAKQRTVQVSTNATGGVINTTEPVTLKNIPTAVSGVRTLDNLADVIITNPFNNDILAYENGIWINSNTAGGTTAYINAIAQANIYANNAYNNAIAYSGNAAAAYSNAVSYVVAQSYANTSQVTSNAATAYSNAVSYVTSQSYANTSQVTSNAATAYSNAVSYVGSLSLVNTSQLSSNLANYQTTAGLNANIASYLPNYTGTINASSINASIATFTGNVSVSSLIVTGNVEVIGANNLSITDNMIYLNSNAAVNNPDLGFAGNYNDGTYHHAGFFRDHVSGTWKVFDNYLPEPDASVYIDQTNSTFHIANFQANTIFVGNTTVYSTVNTTNFTGTANNTLYVGSIDAANVVSNAQLQANIQYFVNTSQLSSNLANYQTTAGLAANVATLASNTSNYVISTVRTVNTNYSLTANDSLILANAALTLTLPAASAVTGRSFEIKNINTGNVTIVGSGSDKIDGYNNMIIQFKNSMLGVKSTGSGWIIY